MEAKKSKGAQNSQLRGTQPRSNFQPDASLVYVNLCAKWYLDPSTGLATNHYMYMELHPQQSAPEHLAVSECRGGGGTWRW